MSVGSKLGYVVDALRSVSIPGSSGVWRRDRYIHLTFSSQRHKGYRSTQIRYCASKMLSWIGTPRYVNIAYCITMKNMNMGWIASSLVDFINLSYWAPAHPLAVTTLVAESLFPNRMS